MTFLTPRTIGGYWMAESVHPSAPMNFFSTKIVLQQFVLWCVLAAVVALLTLLFTVLGTITCAVLMGMMLAAVRHGPLRAFSISLVFPAVIIGMVHFAKVELPGPQRILLPALCFGVFWVIYISTWVLMRFENRTQSVTTPANATPAIPGTVSAEAASPANELQLEELQGTWRYETSAEGNTHTKIMEVAGRHLSLRVVAADGRVRLVAEAELKLEQSARPGKTAAS